MKNEKVIETAEHVLPGHPDKLCDAAVDRIVEVMRQLDPYAQCGLEMACIFDQVFISGRIAATETALSTFKYRGGCKYYIKQAYKSAGYGERQNGETWIPLPDKLNIHENLCLGPFEEEERELRHLSDDQAICVGYANLIETTDHLPPAVWLARRIVWYLSNEEQRLAAGAGPDGKVIVRVERKGSEWRPLHVSLSLSHRQDCDWLKLRQYAESVVEEACKGIGTPKLTLNGGGMFVSVGPNGDNGLSGKKLVVDAYGPTVPIGGGAWSGKDLHKVDRLGGMLARQLAKRIVKVGLAGEALVFLEYLPGGDAPAQALVRLNGRSASIPLAKLLNGVCLDNETVWQNFNECKIPFDELACWGHHVYNLPWER